MSASIKFSGTYEAAEHALVFEVNKSDQIMDAAIKTCCEKMQQDEIEELTMELEDDTFIFFHQKEGHISFVSGELSQYASLTSRLKKGLEGKVAVTIEKKSTEKAKPVPENKTAVSSPVREDHAIIHQAFLQPMEQFEKAYKTASLYFQPFEDPGGDFYWTKDYQYKNLVVVGDSTGHGVHGAMISMSVLTLLKQHFQLPPTWLVESVMDFHKKLKNLTESDDVRSFDAELGFIMLDKRTGEATFAGSGINLIHKRDEECTLFKTRKSYLAKGKAKEFVINLERGDQLFMFSDGITDQFDNEDRKKLGLKGMKRLLTNSETKEGLEEFLECYAEFKQSTQAMDDQTLLSLTY